MLPYRHTQPAPLMWGAAALGAGVLAFGATQAGSPAERAALLGGLGLVGLSAYLFASLTVEVDAREVRFHFGPGFWPKRFALDEVEAVEAVRNHPLYGWGIRLTPHGWLYNVSGLGAVELRLRGGRRVRIGTDEPEELLRAIEVARG
jgi:hypothetical protein